MSTSKPTIEEKSAQSLVRGSTWRPEEMTEVATGAPQGVPVATTPSSKLIAGAVRALQERADERGRALSFRVEQHDAEGRALQVIPVEMRGFSFQGFLSEGDWVEIRGRWKPGKTLHPRALRNLSTGGRFRVRGRQGVRNAVALVLFVIVALFMVMILLTLTGIRIVDVPFGRPSPIKVQPLKVQ